MRFIKLGLKALFCTAFLASVQGATYEVTTVEAMYSEEGDLNSLDIFAGDFTNWGYYKNTSNESMSFEERLEASQNLYEICAEHLELKPADSFLEVSCGKGGGLRYLKDKFNLNKVSAVDMSHNYLKYVTKKLPKVHLFQQDAQILDLKTSFDKILCLEAAQHYQNIEAFLTCATKHLKPGGTFVLSTFFGNSEGAKSLADGIETVEKGVDLLHPISTVIQVLTKHGLDVKTISIGEHVFPGYDKWISQVYPKSWGRKWVTLWQQGVIDYYIIVAKSPIL